MPAKWICPSQWRRQIAPDVILIGKGNRMFHGFTVTYFADKNDIRCLAQGIFQRIFITVGIHPDFTLVDDGFLVLVNKFDWVFNGDDMTGAVGIAVVNQ